MAKVKKLDVPYTQVPNVLLSDNSLSAIAKALWAYMQSKPDNWQFSSVRIQKDFKEGRKPIQKALTELEESGYLTRKKLKNGRMCYFLGLKQPMSQFGSEPIWLSADLGPISNKELVVIKSNTYAEASSAEEEFSTAKWIDKLLEDKQRHVRVIGVYFLEHRKAFGTPNFSNQKEADVGLRRHLRASKEVSSFENGKIKRAMLKAFDKVGSESTLETVVKYLTK